MTLLGDMTDQGLRTGRHVMDDLISLLVQMALKPGDKLPPEIELARLLGVGRPKLRETLTAWQWMGIVSRNKGAGTTLSVAVSGRTRTMPLSVAIEAESLLRTLAVRRPLEIEAVRIATTVADDKARYQIMARMHDLMAVFEAGANWQDADQLFHAAIHDATGNPLFGQVIHQMHSVFREIYTRPSGLPYLASDTIPLHRPLADAVVSGDTESAVALMIQILDTTEAEARTLIARKAS